MMSMYDDETKQQLYRLLGGGTLAERQARAEFDNQQFVHIPLLTLLGCHMHGDPSQAIFVRGLGERLKVEITLNPLTMWYETDDSTSVVIGSTTTTLATTTSTVAVQSASLNCEFYHIFDAERAQLANLSKGKRRMLIQDYRKFLVFVKSRVLLIHFL